MCMSLSARRAWIEIGLTDHSCGWTGVALRKESVDRNIVLLVPELVPWVALRKESVDRNLKLSALQAIVVGRSPQGERG